MKDRNEYLNQLKNHHIDDPIATNTDIPQVQYLSDSTWKVVGLWHLSGEQNGGNHHVYIDLIDANNNVLLSSSMKVHFKWEGQRIDEIATPVSMDKKPPEPICNIAIWHGQILSIWLSEFSDIVYNLRTDFPSSDEGNSLFHQSFYVVFQMQQNNSAYKVKGCTKNELSFETKELAETAIKELEEKYPFMEFWIT